MQGATMGTFWSAKVVVGGAPVEAPDAVRTLVEAELDHVNELMSHYLERSELSRFNAHCHIRDLEPYGLKMPYFFPELFSLRGI